MARDDNDKRYRFILDAVKRARTLLRGDIAEDKILKYLKVLGAQVIKTTDITSDELKKFMREYAPDGAIKFLKRIDLLIDNPVVQPAAEPSYKELKDDLLKNGYFTMHNGVFGYVDIRTGLTRSVPRPPVPIERLTPEEADRYNASVDYFLTRPSSMPLRTRKMLVEIVAQQVHNAFEMIENGSEDEDSEEDDPSVAFAPDANREVDDSENKEPPAQGDGRYAPREEVEYTGGVNFERDRQQMESIRKQGDVFYKLGFDNGVIGDEFLGQKFRDNGGKTEEDNDEFDRGVKARKKFEGNKIRNYRGGRYVPRMSEDEFILPFSDSQGYQNFGFGRFYPQPYQPEESRLNPSIGNLL